MPPQLFLGFGRIAQKPFHFGGAVKGWIDAHAHRAGLAVDTDRVLGLALPEDIHLESAPGFLDEFADRMALAGGQDVVVRTVLLQHHPHAFHIVAGEAPVPPDIEIAELKDLLLAMLDAREGQGDLTGHEMMSAQGRLVIEQNSRRRMQAVGLPVIRRYPMTIGLGGAIGATRMKRRCFRLRRFTGLAEHFRGGGLIEPGAGAYRADCFENSGYRNGIDFRGVDRLIERRADEALRPQIVELVGLQAVYQTVNIGILGQIEWDDFDILVDAEFRQPAGILR